MNADVTYTSTFTGNDVLLPVNVQGSGNTRNSENVSLVITYVTKITRNDLLLLVITDNVITN